MVDIYKAALNDFSYYLALTEIQIFKDRQRWIAESQIQLGFKVRPRRQFAEGYSMLERW